jgi:hypothetical protein
MFAMARELSRAETVPGMKTNPGKPAAANGFGSFAPNGQRVFMKRPGRGIYAASCVIAAKGREVFRQPCNADAEAA